MFKTSSKDNSSLFLKLLFRKSFLSVSDIDKNVALDLFAGKGQIASKLYLEFKELHLVEKNPLQFKILSEKFSFLPQAHLHQSGNMKFLKNKLKYIPEINLVDFDAYGSPNKQILSFFSIYKLKKPLLIFATDGSILARIRGADFSPELYLSGPDLNPSSNPVEHKAKGYDPLLIKNYEKLIICFWDKLSKTYSFKINLFKIIWKKGGQVAYYGLLIKP